MEAASASAYAYTSASASASSLFVEKLQKETAVCLKTVEEIKGKQTIKVIWLFELLGRNK